MRPGRDGEVVDVWKAAVDRFSSSRRSSEAHPSDTLRSVLVRLASWGMSTGGVERMFGRRATAGGVTRTELDEGHESDDAHIWSLGDSYHHLQEQVAIGARVVWADYYGTPRSSPAKRRSDYGASKKEEGAKTGERAWVSSRRRVVTERAQSAGISAAEAAEPRAHIVGMGGWTAEMEQEAGFQRAKRTSRLHQALDEGVLLRQDLPDLEDEDGLLREHGALEDHVAKRRRACASSTTSRRHLLLLG